MIDPASLVEVRAKRLYRIGSDMVSQTEATDRLNRILQRTYLEELSGMEQWECQVKDDGGLAQTCMV